jgi:hypothetical protein
MINRSAFVPILHPKLEGYYRTPVWVEPDSYTVCVAENVHRYYNDKTVPNEVKAVVTMVNAFPNLPYHVEATNPISAYVCVNPKQEEIGWRADDRLYILVLPNSCLENMYITGVGDG